MTTVRPSYGYTVRAINVACAHHSAIATQQDADKARMTANIQRKEFLLALADTCAANLAIGVARLIRSQAYKTDMGANSEALTILDCVRETLRNTLSLMPYGAHATETDTEISGALFDVALALAEFLRVMRRPLDERSQAERAYDADMRDNLAVLDR